jgi:hypothetical protein
LKAPTSVSSSAQIRETSDLDARLGTQRGDQVVDLAGRDAVHVGLHHHRVQRHVDPPPRGQQRREEGAGARLGDLDRQVPSSRGDGLVPGPVAPGGAGLGALVRVGADVRGRLRVDQRLQDGVQQPAHQLTIIGAAQRLGQLEQGRLVQGHRVKSFHEFLGRYSQSLTRWLLHARDRHDHQTKEPELHHPKGLTHWRSQIES